MRPHQRSRTNPLPPLGSPRRRLFGFVAPALLGALALTTRARPVNAQSDLSPPLPNVLLLVDTSGSMEYMTGSTSFPTCTPTTNNTSTKSRWIDLVEVLTGSITNYRCEAIDRKATTFRDGEYGVGGPLATAPYDYLYDNPYHRPLSGNCAVGPGTLTTNVWDWHANSFKQHPYDNTGATCGTAFTQSQDGILDAFQYSVRFGLMTFDSHADASTGFSGTNTRQSAQGVLGTWSYIFGATSTGKPMSCLTAAPPFEVGARNAAAPPWEGRMIPFGNPSTGSTEYLTKKSRIEEVLLATRPYGPTPIAGLLKDASDFLTLDNTKDPMAPAVDFGPYNDPYIKDSYGACRERRIILLSDGQPNMDLRPDCSDGALEANCPFKKPEKIALALKSLTPPIETSVIAFALPQFNVVGRGTVTCNDLTDSDFDSAQPSGLCQSTTPADLNNGALQACCTLNKIAVAGGSGTKPRAWFADDRESLSKALSAVLSELAPVTTRSPPTIGGAAGGSQGFRFYPSAAPVKEQPWTGDLQRQRFTCENGVAKALNIDVNSQDDFATNLNTNPGDRYFSSITASAASGRSVRPYYASQVTGSDGLGSDGGTRYVGKRDAWVAATTPAMIEVDATTCPSPTGNLTATACRDRYLKWLVGLDNNTQYSRCTESGQCYLMGDILRSAPRVVGAPRDFVRDETYDVFVKNQALRPVVVYTSTNDGFLHAFKAAANDPADTDKVLGPGAKNNELWAFVPPAVLPHLRKQYPGTHQALLDGVPVVKDVVATIDNNAELIRLQRSRSDAQTATGTWRTILLSSLGSQNPAGGGYFALDVTNPALNTSALSSNNAGPRFLWQLTKDAGNRPLFGRGAEPVITTVYVSLDNQPAMQVPVAILPGGQGSAGVLVSGNPCPTTPRTYSGVTEARFTIRGQVGCYPATADQAGRSLTIVRLDNGRVLRTFRQATSEIIDADLKVRVGTPVDIDSPISGRPVAFPSQTGAIADRAFVGDQDGKLWKVDLSSTNPLNWTMKVFFDTFAKDANNSSTPAPGPLSGQPIVLPPVLSVDENGDVTVVVATGDQETVGASSTLVNYVWSLTEKTTNNRSSTYTKVNWYLPLTGGERVVGAMSLFNSQLFFTTVAPVPTAVLNTHPCALDTGKVWGMDYLVPKDVTDISKGGVGRLPLAAQPDQQSLTAQQVTGSSNAAMFGVAVAQVPSCATIGDSIANDFMGYKAEQAITSITPGDYQLVMTYRDGTTPANNLKVNVATVKLKPPASSARVDSWAAIFE